jgi:hypothetical protein
MPPVAGWLAAVFERERGVMGERGELGSGTSSGAISIDEGIWILQAVVVVEEVKGWWSWTSS